MAKAKKYRPTLGNETVDWRSSFDEVAPARIQAPPHIAKATKPLVHSFPSREWAAILGICSVTTKRKNRIPSRIPAGRVIFGTTAPIAAAMNATPTKYAQNSRPEIQAGTSVATKLAYKKC